MAEPNSSNDRRPMTTLPTSSFSAPPFGNYPETMLSIPLVVSRLCWTAPPKVQGNIRIAREPGELRSLAEVEWWKRCEDDLEIPSMAIDDIDNDEEGTPDKPANPGAVKYLGQENLPMRREPRTLRNGVEWEHWYDCLGRMFSVNCSTGELSWSIGSDWVATPKLELDDEEGKGREKLA